MKRSLRRWLRMKLDRARSRFHEGPHPPARLFEPAQVFRVAHPDATADDWVSFAQVAIASAYREGYTRGFEWRERDLEAKGPDHPDILEDRRRHDWMVAEEQRRAMRSPLRDEFEDLPPEHREALLRERLMDLHYASDHDLAARMRRGY